MIIQTVSEGMFLDALAADPYSDYSPAAARWIYEYLSMEFDDLDTSWEMDLPAIRGEFTEVPAADWEEFRQSYQVWRFCEVPGGYIAHHT